jgi:hypothetical protein
MTRPIHAPTCLPCAAAAINIIDLPVHNYRIRLIGKPLAYRRAPRLAPGVVLIAIVATLGITASFPGHKQEARQVFDSSKVSLAAAMLDIGNYDGRP